ncbi:MAG: hypothetical protein AAF652_00920 [Cyanobacteria bacterium P01_C01_bin.72]
MSKGWAAIVYGRTYHLDFRFITIPHDFTEDDLNWASQYIVATTKRARNLADSPRWSLFKNNHYCVVGTTCMIKNLIGKTVKDDQGRPLYIYVGYVTQLDQSLQLQELPTYGNLDNFQILYQEIEKVWLVKNYDSKKRKPTLSQYDPLELSNLAIAASTPDMPRLNSQRHDPEQIYLWSNTVEQNRLLWQTAAIAPFPAAICLNIKGKALLNSLFLNQSSSQTEKFQVREKRLSPSQAAASNLNHNHDTQPNQANTSLSQKISHRAKEDIDLTLQQAAKVAIAGQELISNLSDWNQLGETDSSAADLSETDSEVPKPEFGFKLKKPTANNKDWF